MNSLSSSACGVGTRCPMPGCPIFDHSIDRFFQRTIWLVLALAVLLATGLRAQSTNSSTTGWSLPSDDEIRHILMDRIDVQHKSVGMVVGILTPAGRRIITHGRMNQGDPRPLNGETIFEIGSFTKVFTALLLADMVQRGEVTLNDALQQYLPSDVTVPTRNGRTITLVDLATHTSGLPFQPPDMTIGDAHAYATYTDAGVYKFLSTYALENDIGSTWSYSNMGFGLLGTALARRAGMDYETLLRERITGPLELHSTAITLPPGMKEHLGVGHTLSLDPAPEWKMPVFAGAAALKSNTNDILTFLAAFLGYEKTPLAPAMRAMLETRRPGPNLQQALGWWIIPFGEGDEGIVTFAGATFGYTNTVAFDPKTKIGVVVFSNSAANDGGLAWHLLRPAWPIETSQTLRELSERKEIAIDPGLLERYVGQYQPKVGDAVTIERHGDSLFFKSPTAPFGLLLRAESPQRFFIREVDLQVTFEIGPHGQASSIAIRFGGLEDRAPRIVDKRE